VGCKELETQALELINCSLNRLSPGLDIIVSDNIKLKQGQFESVQ
jgi:hypothetical protein